MTDGSVEEHIVAGLNLSFYGKVAYLLVIYTVTQYDQ